MLVRYVYRSFGVGRMTKTVVKSLLRVAGIVKVPLEGVCGVEFARGGAS